MIFDYTNYRKYLDAQLSPPIGVRGAKSGLCKHLNCQTGFLSQVLGGQSNFSLEHAILTSEYLKHSSEEEKYFLLLVEYEKAGSARLKKYFQKEIDSILKSRNEIGNRITINNELTKEMQDVYYSHWLYSAIHVLCSIPMYQTLDQICDKLRIERQRALKILDFLTQQKLVVTSRGYYRMGPARIHLRNDSPFILRHHVNWRLKVIEELGRGIEDNLHYSSVMTLSKDDFKKIKNILLDAIERTEKIMAPSKEEICCIMNFDLREI